MAKLEVIEIKGRYTVQATFREPFEYFFEIAVHNARYASKADAEKLIDIVRRGLRNDREENGYRSESFIICRHFWTYQSSAYKDRMGTEGEVYEVEENFYAKLYA